MSARTNKIIFITGTDTCVGKTLLTALLLHHLHQTGVHALAMKPFCSGGRADVTLLQSLQRGELTDEEMNPFYFDEPIAPLVAAKKKRRNIRLSEVVERINCLAEQCECLLVEGSGGLLVPLGKDYTVANLIEKLDCQVIVVARNRLGTINHTLLTIKALGSSRRGKLKPIVTLMEQGRSDVSSLSNLQTLARLLKPIPILEIPFLGKNASRFSLIQTKYPSVKPTLVALLSFLQRWSR